MKALTDEQIEEVRRRYAAGETMRALGKEYHVSDATISNYIRSGAQDNAKPAHKPTAEEAQHSTETIPESAPETPDEPRPESTELYEIARGFEIFVNKHTEGDFSISVSRSNGVTIITAAAGNEEITIKRKDNADDSVRKDKK